MSGRPQDRDAAADLTPEPTTGRSAPTGQRPVLLPTEQDRPLSRSGADLYLPVDDRAGDRARDRAGVPLVVLVHGGLPPGLAADGPLVRAYAAQLARRGVAAAVVRLPVDGSTPPEPAALWSTVHGLRLDERVDGDRVALWFFGDGSLLMGEWLDDRPRWLRAVAASCPRLRPPADLAAAGPAAADVVAKAVGLPMLVMLATHSVGREPTESAASVAEFLTEARACGARPEVLEAPDGGHGFDLAPPIGQSVRAVESAVNWVVGQVLDEPAVPYQRLAAYALLQRPAPPDAAEVLLTRISARGFNPGTWTLPGGGVDHGEDVRQGLTREVHEETGLVVRVGALLDVHSVHFTGRSPATGRLEDFHGVHLIFDASPQPASQQPTVVEVDGTTDAVAWVPVGRVRAGAVPVFDVVRHALGLPTD